jgi:hypothetical protein
MTVINFNDLSGGTVVDDAYSALGVTITASGGSNQAMIFDTANPTGGDTDLATSNLGGALIISEDGDSSDPDDNATGGTLSIAFDTATSVESLTFLDNEEGAMVRFYDQAGALIGEQWVDGTGDNSQNVVTFDMNGVYLMEIELCGSGAIDDLVFESATAISDGTVEGTSDGDLIDVDYAGDPDGDLLIITMPFLPVMLATMILLSLARAMTPLLLVTGKTGSSVVKVKMTCLVDSVPTCSLVATGAMWSLVVKTQMTATTMFWI